MYFERKIKGGKERKRMRKRKFQVLLTWRGLFGEAEQLFDLLDLHIEITIAPIC